MCPSSKPDVRHPTASMRMAFITQAKHLGGRVPHHAAISERTNAVTIPHGRRASTVVLSTQIGRRVDSAGQAGWCGRDGAHGARPCVRRRGGRCPRRDHEIHGGRVPPGIADADMPGVTTVRILEVPSRGAATFAARVVGVRATARTRSQLAAARRRGHARCPA